MDWDVYADTYDAMCEVNPAYRDNLGILERYVASWDLPANSRICDLGAGTGNYIVALHRLIPGASFVHVDFDHAMNERARVKYKAVGAHAEIIENQLQNVDLAASSMDLAVCVNSLYAIHPQREQLEKIRTWLKPTGRLFVIDFGRRMQVLDWAVYVFRNSVKERGLKETIALYRDNYEVIRQNRRGSRAQGSGLYWLHGTAEFGETLEACGFDVQELYPCYRDCADLAVCVPRAKN
jgi:ubiquinone/menaquinone biosynthesis C-methylase UbiE